MVPSRTPRKSGSNAKLTPSQIYSNKWTERLIDLVFEQQALYNHAHADYRNIAKRDLIWEHIGTLLNTSAEDVKKRWRSLRDTYSRIVRNRQRKGYTDSSKNTKWTWIEKMEPLGNYLSTSTYADGEIDSSDLLEVKIDDDSGSGSTTLDSAPDHARIICDPADVYVDDGISRVRENGENGDPNPDDGGNPEINLATSSSGKRPYPFAYDPHLGYFEGGKKVKMDPIDQLFLAYASTVKTFSARRQAIAKLKIAEVLMHEEIQHQEDLKANKDD